MASWLSSIGVDDRVVTCTIARGEILFGLERLAPGRRRTELEGKAAKLFAVLPCEPIPPAAADRYANLKVSQQRRGLPLDENDLWIVATSLAIEATLVSNDSDFGAIEGLAIIRP
jgi:Predicted nucleic acid-binding protein, contains PIN domain